ncbi:hypothetical protein CANTEDRAFT_125766 [Yamadazyma tenuis ATCC 10573]|uniref:Chromatin modification-related protein n=1 Tax=Candida tenuis (strain ATCC 10573 / BCRC 21748 / CBS 615 / JCM 9827 / NBRC 10315 / NRRL Y-1498 / VKM Y-70) TaxID=590646 RepID=G3BBE1_CANTC|nr:uncharacterized protein CANTEDRAFT_125766 [Yamadazyma tenuis ATCC 10573]EGV62167.1 hypothetical protein CANTEDRAFT_125766 [Yamadazyma tenuis ATCC 10573]
MTLDLPPRQKSQRLRSRSRHNAQQLRLQSYLNKSKTISSINELLPGLNDITDAFEALPSDIIKYFTLLKEIDAKCIGTVPLITSNISQYIDGLHQSTSPSATTKAAHLSLIRDHISDIIPCLEEKMHVTSIATDVVEKHLFRINNDFKLIINNNEIPESIRIGPLNHPALIMDATANDNPNRSAQSSRSETRREALAAKKQSKDDDYSYGVVVPRREGTPSGDGKKKRSRKEGPTATVSAAVVSSNPAYAATAMGSPSRSITPQPKKKIKVTREESANEPTYCYCNQVSFGEMVGCDGDDCKREWFHLPCIGFKHPPKGKWYCDDCVSKQKKMKRV